MRFILHKEHRHGRPFGGPARAVRALIGLGALCGALLIGAGAGQAADFTLRAARELIEDGLIGYLAPRFALKHGLSVDIELIGKTEKIKPDDAVILPLGEAPPGAPAVLEGPAGRYAVIAPEEGPAARFARWLTSEVGRRSIAAFRRPDGSAPYRPAAQEKPTAAAADFPGDAQRGEALSYANCGRCHVVGARNRMKSIGSTPSFAALRALPDWEARFRTFWLRNPHPAVVRIKNVSQDPDIASPSPIHPVTLSEADAEDILAFVARIAPADLGAPIQMR